MDIRPRNLKSSLAGQLRPSDEPTARMEMLILTKVKNFILNLFHCPKLFSSVKFILKYFQ